MPNNITDNIALFITIYKEKDDHLKVENKFHFALLAEVFSTGRTKGVNNLRTLFKPTECGVNIV